MRFRPCAESRRDEAVATFVGDKYPNQGSRKHAALCISQTLGGIWVMNRWTGVGPKPKVSERFPAQEEKKAAGATIDPSNNAEACSVID